MQFSSMYGWCDIYCQILRTHHLSSPNISLSKNQTADKLICNITVATHIFISQSAVMLDELFGEF